jgi:hypothetical protein
VRPQLYRLLFLHFGLFLRLLSSTLPLEHPMTLGRRMARVSPGGCACLQRDSAAHQLRSTREFRRRRAIALVSTEGVPLGSENRPEESMQHTVEARSALLTA